MITSASLLPMLATLGFSKNSNANRFVKTFSEYENCTIAIDFDSKKLVYPEGIIGRERNTSFDKPENFVVFECVHRLLEKGYRPESIELEKVWTLGHEQKGGRADICVYTSDKSTVLFILECKTAGAEYKKAVKQTKEDGGQIFSYWQQERATQWLGIYTSDFNNESVTFENLIINCSDDANILKLSQKDNSVLVYANPNVTGNAKNLFEVWTKTYQQEFHEGLIFGDDTSAYRIGIKPLRKKNLKDFTPDDKIVNKFEEILRHNNVSDKENAFNRLVALFICKLVDEISKEDHDIVDFQYKVGTDTYETLQDRLQLLHKRGMEEFMKEKIFYVAADYAEQLFKQYTGSQRREAIKDLNNTIRILKFYSNNDFAFKDVHNEELFFQNGKILVEVVQLFERYRIVYRSRHQFLGDLFEQLLSKGFKQNEGQFFTPMPITRFIWDALPIQNYIAENGLPKVIDYSCGAGHFLTEAVAAIDEVRANTDNSWVEKHIWGIEKDYRLSRVSKISMFMNGAGGANIIFGDGLENYPDKQIESGEFDILVANPPYAVSAFKSHLKLRNNEFDILDKISSDGSEIETLFVERAVQLLKSGGIAAIILPSPILSKSIGSYVMARELLISNFYIRSIVSLESKTFGATNTSTVILFLERFNEPPKLSSMAKDVAEAILEGRSLINWEDQHIFSDYLRRIRVDETSYRDVIRKSLDKSSLAQIEYFKGYVEAFEQMSQNYPKRISEEERRVLELKRIYDLIFKTEFRKLMVFTLVRGQKTTIITAPSDNQKQKEFLGYDWSSRKGAEGIIIKNPGGKLYNAEDRFARGTLACKIRNAYTGAYTELTDELETYSATYSLDELISFSQPTFDINIRTNLPHAIKFQGKYPFIKLGELVEINSNDINPQNSPDKKFIYVDIASVQNGTGEISYDNEILGKDAPLRARRVARKGDTLISTVRPNLKAFAYLKENVENVVYSTGFAILRSKDEMILKNQIIYIFFMNLDIIMDQITAAMPKGQYPSINKTDIENIKIPLPPIKVQENLISECEKIDEEFATSRMTMDAYRRKITDIFDNLQIVKKSKIGGVIYLNQICEYQTNRISISSINTMNYISTENMLPNCEGRILYEGTPDVETVVEYKKGDILISNIRPYLQKIWFADCDGGCNPDVLVIRVKDTERFSPKFVYYTLRRKMFFDHMMKDKSGVKMPRGNKINNLRFEIPNIELKDQLKILLQVEAMEKHIQRSINLMNTCEIRKRKIVYNLVCDN